ncbi:zinc finger domain-containing protein [Micromonospora halophytica]|uniref:DNA-binding phage zinc finger domain-containing protein n=1 Tax=Micromonospora halophytica TaxID=47864 RepID=A0A1C5J091_9ACTN|nr:hypothetical protein [Micromonospora halophytica]SCG64000.1 hypothetical protein GA0070560_11973 [Micromonospora halophytica]
MTLTADSFTPGGWAGYLAFKAEYAEPDTLDFRCPRCKAEPGQLCPGRPLGHAQRQDRMIHARQEWEYDAINSGINAGNEEDPDDLHRSGYRCTTDNYLKYMRRNNARVRKPGEPATAVTFGEWLLAHTAKAMPLAYLGLRPSIRPEMDAQAVMDLMGDVGDDGASDRALERAIDQWRHQTGQEVVEL